MSESMDQFLAEYYGTAKTASAPAEDDLEKQAQVELFAKLAAANGIDLGAMTDEQVEQLYTQTFSKTAGEMEEQGEHPPEKKHEEKVEEAKKEHEEKKEAHEKLAEADFLGRVVAHAFVQEVNKIATAAAEDGGEKTATLGNVAGHSSALKVRTLADKLRSGVHHAKEGVKSIPGKVKEVAKKVDEKGAEGARRVARLGEGGKTVPLGHSKTRDFIASQGHRVAAGAAAAGAAGAGAHHAMKEKKSSAIDELAAPLAVEKAAAAGWDGDEAADRVAAIMILGPSDEGSKVAAAADLNQAVDVRAAELLELAGYPVNWE